MKNLRSLPLVLLLFTLAHISHAQERQNATALTFAAKSPQITEATGWYLDNGKWIDNKNHISDVQMDGFSGHENNFKKYHVIIYQKVDGEYKYPLTQVDWKDYDQIYAVVFNQDEYDQIKSVVNKKDGKDLKIKLKAFGKKTMLNGAYSDAVALDLVQKILSADMTMSSDCFVINAQNAGGKDVMRFLLPGACIFDNLKDEYYEVKLDDFKKLLID